MIRFSRNIIRSFIDVQNHTSMIIHAIGCNFRCYQCFNYKSCVLYPRETVTDEYILKQVSLNGNLFDAIVLSGGEFLLNPLPDVIDFCKSLRKAFRGAIIVNTNGHDPSKMLTLIEDELVDGFHTDMKLPYHLIETASDADLVKNVLGVDISQQSIDLLLRSLELTVATDKGYNQIRSVRYPMIGESAFEQNREYVEVLNKKYGKQVPYHVNDFLSEEEINANSN